MCGLKVSSTVEGELTHQLILVLPTPESRFADAALDLEFQGRYAVVTLDEQMRCRSLYIGEGAFLRYGDVHPEPNGRN